MLKNKKKLIKRIIFALILLIFFIPTFILGENENYIFKAISMTIYCLAAMIALYELLISMKINKNIALISTICIPLFFILPLSKFDALMGLTNKKYSKEMSLNQITWSAIQGWQMWIFISLFSLLPLLLQTLIFKINNYFKKQIIITTIFSIICFFVKLFWAYNTKSFLIILFFVMISILTDTFGYFGGMFFGKKLFKGKKLAPKISPNKTWAGFVIGIFISIAFAIPIGYFMNIWKFNIANNKKIELILTFFMGIILPIISVLGDLFFSYIKRILKIKDFSKFIPGHGGLLDRVDSHCFVFLFTGIILLLI